MMYTLPEAALLLKVSQDQLLGLIKGDEIGFERTYSGMMVTNSQIASYLMSRYDRQSGRPKRHLQHKTPKNPRFTGHK